MAKVLCSEAIYRVADRCVQVLGGQGVTGETLVERIFREVRGFRIYDGPSEVHRWSLARRIARREQLVSERIGPGALFDLTGRVAVVTGGGRGDRPGHRRGAGAFGARVVLTGRTQATLDGGDRDAGAATTCWRDGGRLARGRRDRVARLGARGCGRIDILVNNAGVNPIYPGSSGPASRTGRTSSTSTSPASFSAASISAA